LLAVRQRSRRELELRLLGAGFPEVEVTEVLGRQAHLDDDEF
jgi:SOS response regulatory protein OraA/RecX